MKSASPSAVSCPSLLPQPLPAAQAQSLLKLRPHPSPEARPWVFGNPPALREGQPGEIRRRTLDRMGSPLHVRVSTLADLPAILALLAQPALDDGQVLSLSEAERLWRRIHRNPDHRIHVALEGEVVVGSFALLVMDNLAHLGAPSAVIEDVVVDPRRQGRGIGRAMLRHALALASARGCYKAVLSSNLRRTRAHAFYESLDFERHGYSFRTDLPLPDPVPPQTAPGSEISRPPGPA